MDSSNLSLLNISQAEKFLLDCTQNTIVGGFASRPEATPDPMHSCLALASLSLWNHRKYNLDEIDPVFVVSRNVLDKYRLNPKE